MISVITYIYKTNHSSITYVCYDHYLGCAGYGFKHNTVGSHITRAALIYMQNQIEPGHCCPIVMTAAAIPVLKRINGMEDDVDKILSQKYDPRNLPIQHKDGMLSMLSIIYISSTINPIVSMIYIYIISLI